MYYARNPCLLKNLPIKSTVQPSVITIIAVINPASPPVIMRVFSETHSPYFSRVLPSPKSHFHLYCLLSFCNIFLLHKSLFLHIFYFFLKKLLTFSPKCVAVLADFNQLKRPFCLRHSFNHFIS